jgi:hypothetical protein
MTRDYCFAIRSTAAVWLWLLAAVPAPAAQQPVLGTVRGQVTDQTAAVMSGAVVTVEGVGIGKPSVTTDADGRYRFERLPPGPYTVTIERPGFAEFVRSFDVKTNTPIVIDARLSVAIAVAVTVKDRDGVSAELRKNLSGFVLAGKDLAALPDNPRFLLQRILELAGSTGRPDDVAVYVDGFHEYRRLPSRDLIQLVRINSNLYSAEYEQPSAQRIEIVTKPGAAIYHGDIGLQMRATPVEARDPITGVQPETRYSNYKGYLQGPLVKGHVGFVVSAGYWEQDDNAFLHATVLDPSTFASVPVSARIATPTAVTSQTGQIDFKWGADLVNASFARTSQTDRNLGLQSGFDLAEHAYDRSASTQVGRVWWTRIAGHAVNDLRIEINHDTAATTPLSTAPAVVVLDAFNAGGNQSGWTDRSTTSTRVGDTVAVQRGRHTIKSGVQLETISQASVDLSDFGGTYTFGSDVERDGAGRPLIDAAGHLTSIAPIDRYRRTLLGRPGYVPSQYFIVRGNPDVASDRRSFDAFVLDDWSPGPRAALSYGVRYETQNDVSAHLNVAPRAGFSYLLDDRGTAAVKLGGGLFYSRVPAELAFETRRLDGVNRREYTIESPSFFTTAVSPVGQELPAQSTVYTVAPDLRNPLTFISTASVERQLPARMFGVVQYTFSKGADLLRLRNIAAPVTDTAGAPSDPVLQFESTGRSLQHQLMFGLRQNLEDFSLYANYTYGRKRSDTDGPYTLPADSRDLATEYGWATDDQRHVIVAGATVVIDDLLISPSFSLSSGRPFNITTGRDNNNDTRFTDRPGFATAGAPGAIDTRFGTFDPNPGSDEAIIPRNFGREPYQVDVDVSATKTLRKGLMLTVDVQNFFNYARLYGSTGVLTSQVFGTPNLALNGRRLWVMLRYGF